MHLCLALTHVSAGSSSPGCGFVFLPVQYVAACGYVSAVLVVLPLKYLHLWLSFSHAQTHTYTHTHAHMGCWHTHINVVRDPWLLMHRCERKPIGTDPVSGLLVWDSSSLAWTQLVFLPSSLSMHTRRLCCIPQQNWKSTQHWYVLYV